MNIKLGFSTGIFYPSESDIKQCIQAISTVETDHLELNFGSPEELIYPDPEFLELVGVFKSKSIHAPFKNIRYSQKFEREVDLLLNIAEKIRTDVILFHPDTVEDFDWLYNKVGSLIAYENMDNRKSFGNKIEELETLFVKYPSVSWHCDVNHLFTMDPTLKITQDFHTAFKNRLYGYHLSGYGSPQTLHTCLYITHENQIIDAILDLSKPIIHEGGAPDQVNFLEKEYAYILDYLNNKK